MNYKNIYTYIDKKIGSITCSLNILKNEIENILKEELKRCGISISIECMEGKVYLQIWSKNCKEYKEGNNISLEEVLSDVFGVNRNSLLRIAVPYSVWISEEEKERIAERFI